MASIDRWISITPGCLNIDGNLSRSGAEGKEFLAQLYRSHIKDYPKFFKMDPLCKLGFVASELLLGGKDISGDKYSLILFNKSGSLANDAIYQRTIGNDNYYPSPAVFVYTLPNIVTGEIAIRNRMHGETSFYILDRPDSNAMEQIIASSLATGAEGALCGWLECSSENEYKAALFLIGNNSGTRLTAENINRIINI